jgi:hypothetical protein
MEGSSMSVILVGNGESLLGSKMGEKIDSYDTVVRFDGLNIEGYEEDVGTKTDILVLDSFRFLRYMKEEFDDIRDEMYDISEIWLMPNNQTYNEMAITFQNEFNLKFTEKEVNEYKYELGYFSNCICHSQGVNYVSSELYTMLNYTKSGECVDYIGMDFLNTDLNTLKHELIKEENKLIQEYKSANSSWGSSYKPNQYFKNYFSNAWWSSEGQTNYILELKIMKLMLQLNLLNELEVVV